MGLVLAAIVLGLVCGVTEGANDNLPQFKVLCEAYKLASWFTTKGVERELVIRAHSERMLLDIQKVFVAASPPGSEKELAETIEKSDPNWTIREVELENGKRRRRFPQVGQLGLLWKPVSSRLKRIVRTAEKYYSRQGELTRQRDQNESQALKNLKRAISGNDQGTISADSFAGTTAAGNTRRDSCSHDAAASSKRRPGFSLVNDVYCLCGNKDTSSGYAASAACGAVAITEAVWQTGASSDNKLPDKPDENFPKIMQKCGSTVTDPPVRPTPGAINRVIARFEAFIGKSQSTHAGSKNYHFGNGASNSDGVCIGTYNDDAKHVCVNYKAALTGADAPGVAWKNAMSAAAEDLTKVEQLEQEINTLALQIDHLNETAWDVYESALLEEDLRKTGISSVGNTTASISDSKEGILQSPKATEVNPASNGNTGQHDRLAKLALIFSLSQT